MSTTLADQTANWQAETEQSQNTFGAFVRMDLPGYTARMFTGAGQLEWDDGSGTQTWTGIPLGTIDAIPGKLALEAQTLTLQLSGLDSALKTEIMDYLVRKSEVYVWLFYVDSGVIVGDPWLAFSGFVDVPAFTEGEDVTLEIECVDSIGSNFRRTITRRTNTHQQSIFSGDDFYEFSAQIGKTPVAWGVPWEQGSGSGASGNNDYRTPGRVNDDFFVMDL